MEISYRKNGFTSVKQYIHFIVSKQYLFKVPLYLGRLTYIRLTAEESLRRAFVIVDSILVSVIPFMRSTLSFWDFSLLPIPWCYDALKYTSTHELKNVLAAAKSVIQRMYICSYIPYTQSLRSPKQIKVYEIVIKMFYFALNYLFRNKNKI